MPDTLAIVLENRAVIDVSGPDCRDFLQGLVSGDVMKVSPSRAIHAALLTPQGKYLFDFMIAEHEGRLLLDCERDRIGDLIGRLNFYKLRARVMLEDRSEDFAVAALVGKGADHVCGLEAKPGTAGAFLGGVGFIDPRFAELGARAILPRAGSAELLNGIGVAAGTMEDYERLRVALGIADGSRDIEVEKSYLLECNFDLLNGIDFDKGCFIGQELTARTKHRGTLRKRLVPVRIDGPLPTPGTPVLYGGKVVGSIRTGIGDRAIAMLRLEYIAKATESGGEFTAGSTGVVPLKPDWMEVWP